MGSNSKQSDTGIRPRHLHFSEVPHHLQDNDAIHTGYRAFYSSRDCARSVFELHNETGNIWTHMLGCVFFIVCTVVSCVGLVIPPQASASDYLVLGIFLFSAVKCLLCSTVFHIFSAHSHPRIYASVAILDYSGISVLIFGSFLLYINYGLYCYSLLRYTYITICASMCLSGIVLPWFGFFRTSSFRTYRALFFVALGLSSGLIAIHVIYLNGWNELNKMTTMYYYLLEAFFYLFGAFLYAKRIPEVWFPGKLDLWFHSHQLFHVCVWHGALLHYLASVSLMASRLTRDTCLGLSAATSAL